MDKGISLNQLQQSEFLAHSPLAKNRAFYYFFKRVLDVTLAALALVLLSPVMLLVAVLIVLDSAGPVIFAQKRVGAKRWNRDGYSYWQQTTFTCYKFRSMAREADPAMHQAYVTAFIRNDHEKMAALQGGDSEIRKLVHDPRITRVGKFLRKSSLDELPQLWNVLKGDMSLVGPRPDVPYAVKQYKPWHYGRLAAPPGLSGLWQVKGRCQTTFDDMARMDIEYIDNQSLWSDLKILLLTVPAVLLGRGAV
jgi:lipopolysaccharide/colanic/teichoic acid biosynthesis glycosyltransferase